MIYRSLKQGYKYELEVNVVIFSSFLGFFCFYCSETSFRKVVQTVHQNFSALP